MKMIGLEQTERSNPLSLEMISFEFSLRRERERESKKTAE